MFYVSMFSTRQAHKLMKSFSAISNLISNYRLKTEKYLNEKQSGNIDKNAMFYVSMDSIRQALQTNGKLFSNFGIIF